MTNAKTPSTPADRPLPPNARRVAVDGARGVGLRRPDGSWAVMLEGESRVDYWHATQVEVLP